jgi:hypothetical protein
MQTAHSSRKVRKHSTSIQNSSTQPTIHPYANKNLYSRAGHGEKRKEHENNTSHTHRPTYNNNINIR